jgi:hypothetical protein
MLLRKIKIWFDLFQGIHSFSPTLCATRLCPWRSLQIADLDPYGSIIYMNAKMTL